MTEQEQLVISKLHDIIIDKAINDTLDLDASSWGLEGWYEQAKTIVENSKPKPIYVLCEEYDVENGGYIQTINDVVLNEKIKDNELHEYSIVEKEELINNIFSYVNEAKDSDKVLMKEDIISLSEIDDEYIFTSNSSNEYIHSGSENFNEICEQLLDLNKSLK